MAHHDEERAVCRGCGRVLNGKPYHLGGRAYIPGTLKEARSNYYGGYVCSETCDRKACWEMENSFPGAGPAKFLNDDAAARIRSNWGTR